MTDHFADVQQRFGRNATPVETHAPDLVAVDADDFLAELPEPDSGVVTARPCAYDDGIELVLRAHAEWLRPIGSVPHERPRSGASMAPSSAVPAARRILLRWYARHGRSGLPWRTSRTPYRTVVSEFMLVQTQVDRVYPGI